MTWRTLALAGALLAGAGPSSPVEAQVDARLTARLPGPVADSVAAEIDRAQGADLPTEPLVQRALEGASRGADGPRIIAAVRGLRLRLEAAARLMPEASEESALVAAAEALGAGVPEDDVRTVANRSRDWGPPVAPLVLLTDLVGRGVAPDSAIWAVQSLAEAGVPPSSWTVLPLQLDQDIAAGASPSAAAATRVRGLILSRKDGGPHRPPPDGTDRRLSSAAMAGTHRSGVSTYLATELEVPVGVGRDTRLGAGMTAGAGTSRSRLGGGVSTATRLGRVTVELAAAGMRGRGSPAEPDRSSRTLSLRALVDGADRDGTRSWVAFDAVLEGARWDQGEGASGGGSLAAGLHVAELRLSGRAFGVAGSTSQVFRRDTVFTAGEYRFISRRSTRHFADWAELGGEVSVGLELGEASVAGTVGRVWAQVPGVPSSRTVAALSAAVPLPLGLELETAAGWGSVDPFLGRPPGSFLTAGFRWRRSTRPRDLDVPDGPDRVPATRVEAARVTVQPTSRGWALTLHGVDADRVELMGDPTDWLPVPLESAGEDRWRVELRPSTGVQRVLVRTDGGRWHPPPGVPLGRGDYDPPPGIVLVP